MKAAAPARGRAAPVWLLGLICGVAATLAPGFLLLASVLLAPCLAALAFDGGPGKPAARPVLMLGLAATVTPLWQFWSDGHHLATAMALVRDPRGIALAWLVQGAGWIAVEVVPTLIRLALDASARAQTLALRRARAALEAEWGIPPVDDVNAT